VIGAVDNYHADGRKEKNGNKKPPVEIRDQPAIDHNLSILAYSVLSAPML